MLRAFLATAAVLTVASVSNAQYYYNNAINPWNGTVVQTGGTRNPFTGAYTTQQAVFNPYTGYAQQGYTTYNPFTNVRYDGVRTFSPYYGYQYYNQATPAFGWPNRTPYWSGYGAYRPYGYWGY